MIQVSDMKGLLYGQVFFHVVTGFIGCWFVRGTSLNEESSFDMFHAEDRLVFGFKNGFTGYTIEKSEHCTFSYLFITHSFLFTIRERKNAKSSIHPLNTTFVDKRRHASMISLYLVVTFFYVCGEQFVEMYGYLKLG